MKLTLVRHGETYWNKERKIQGITNVALTELGIEQANKLSLSLQHERLDGIFTSPLQRAVDTARAIARYHHNVPVVIENELHELNAGEFEGLSYKDLVGQYDDFLKKWTADHASVGMPKGESLQEVQDRVWPVIARISQTSQNAVVVTHSFVIITILCKIQNINLSDSRMMKISVASKTSVEIENGAASVVLFNDTSHLQDE